MATRTFTMIKPDAVVTDTSGILAMITNAGFKLFLEINSTYCSRCSSILLSTRCKTFYGELVEFMSRGAIVAAILERTTLLKF
jgi:nucleoside-diphosphate kinase